MVTIDEIIKNFKQIGYKVGAKNKHSKIRRITDYNGKKLENIIIKQDNHLEIVFDNQVLVINLENCFIHKDMIVDGVLSIYSENHSFFMNFYNFEKKE